MIVWRVREDHSHGNAHGGDDAKFGSKREQNANVRKGRGARTDTVSRWSGPSNRFRRSLTITYYIKFSGVPHALLSLRQVFLTGMRALLHYLNTTAAGTPSLTPSQMVEYEDSENALRGRGPARLFWTGRTSEIS